MRYNILFGGPAGTGPNFLTKFIGQALLDKGYYVFYSRDYQSLIRGGHNFNVLTFSDSPVFSNDSKIDILVALDDKTEEIHKRELNNKFVILEGKKENMYYAGALFKLLGFSFKDLEQEIKKLGTRVEENLKNATEGYKEEKHVFYKIQTKNKKGDLLSGSEGIAEGAIKSGLDIYYAYPMTPATPVLGELASKQIENNFLVLELENEISVIHGAIGSAITGAKTMVGTSGGGFDLMTEALSMTGMAEIPLVAYLAQRPGPATGVPTYNTQGDLNMARHAGHGEFPRLVFAPGDPIECQELTSQAFYFSQKYKTPAIVMSDKHLAESVYTVDGKVKITPSLKSVDFGKFNSYEHTKEGISTEDAKETEKNAINRLKKSYMIDNDSKTFYRYKIYGKKNCKNIVLGWGSTKGAILDAIKGLDVCFLQILYIDPFPTEILKFFKNKNVILVENNSTAQLAQLIREKIGYLIDDKKKILRFDGRVFLADELNNEIKKRLK